MINNVSDFSIRLATLQGLDRIVVLYRERINWFKTNKIKQWTGCLKTYNTISDIKLWIREKKFYVVNNRNKIVGAFMVALY